MTIDLMKSEVFPIFEQALPRVWCLSQPLIELFKKFSPFSPRYKNENFNWVLIFLDSVL